MARFLTKRLAGAFVVLVLVSLMSFAIIWLVPGDPTAAFLDTSATPEQVERLRRELGLDQPVIVQMLDWYSRILHGDLGHSILLNRSVTAAILERLPVTLSLAGIAFVLALMTGVLAGIVAAVNHNRWPDQVVMTAALIGLSVPDFWLGIMLILLLAVKLGLFPTGGYVPLSEDPLGWLASIFMPAMTLAVIQVGFIARMTRASMLEVLNQDFIRTAEAKGLKLTEIMLRHGLPNALVPVLTVAGIVAGALLGGAVIIEQVFSIPGVGRLIIGGILSRDYPVIQGGLLLLAVIYLAVNLAVDILYAAVDPRVRLE
jgi:peptide/nickel transport system permease protein